MCCERWLRRDLLVGAAAAVRVGAVGAAAVVRVVRVGAVGAVVVGTAAAVRVVRVGAADGAAPAAPAAGTGHDCQAPRSMCTAAQVRRYGFSPHASRNRQGPPSRCRVSVSYTHLTLPTTPYV